MMMLPDKALERHIAILGKTGSGKSNTAKVIAERLMAAGERVCAIDPTGTWWGVRLAADGKRASKFKPVIFGGNHADIQITGDHGAAIAEAIATSSTSAVIDTRLLSVGARTKFFTNFGETLLRTNRGALTLIIDEAHLFAPQGRVNDPQSGAMLHAANNLVSLGRGIGLRIILISQRPAKLHKDSLTQAETLVAMRLIAPQDRKAIDDWIGEWAEPGKGKEIVAGLPSLPTGTAWVWSPEIDMLEKIKFPLAVTFDSGRPLAGEGPTLAPIDVNAVTKQLETIKADVVANDPATLKAEIARLKAELIKSPKPDKPDPKAIEAAEKRGYESGLVQGRQFGIAAAVSALTNSLQALDLNGQLIDATTGRLDRAIWGKDGTFVDFHSRISERKRPSFDVIAGGRVDPEGADAGSNPASAPTVHVNPPLTGMKPRTREAVQSLITAATKQMTSTTDPFLDVAHRVWPAKLSWAGLAACCGRKARGGSFNTRRRALIDGGHVREEGDLVVPTNPPSAPEGVLPADLLEQNLPTASADAFKIIRREPGLSIEDLAGKLGVVPRGGSWNTRMSVLRKNGLIIEAGGLRIAEGLE